jgi:predicted nucleic acid-binding protein
MILPYIDTDVIIRFLTGDDPDKQARTAALFAEIEAGQLEVAAPVTVIADAVYVLSSPRLYHLPRGEVRELLLPILRLPNFRLHNRRAVLRALDLYVDGNLDFGDALIVAFMEQHRSEILYSYDGDFDGIPGVTRRTP